MTSSDDNRLLIRAIIASHFAPPFMFSGVAVALPSMGRELAAGATSLGLVETLFLAANLAFLLPAGRFADASDKRTLYKLGLLAFGLASLLIGLLSSITAILAMRLVQGVASSVLSATGAAILADIVPAHRRGRAFGASLGVAYAGLSLGPICAGLLVDAFGWRAVFLVGAVGLLAGYGLVRHLMPSAWQRPPRSVHRPSAMLLAASVFCLVFGAAAVRRGAPGYAGIAAGLALAAAFVHVQHRLAGARRSRAARPEPAVAAHGDAHPRWSGAVPATRQNDAPPLLDVDLLAHNPTLRTALLVQLLLYMSAFVTTFVLNFFMQVSLGRSPRTAGYILAIGSGVMALLAPIFGRLADRVRPHRLATAGIACVLVTGLLALALDAGTRLPYIALMLSFQGLGFALFSSPNMTIIMNAGAAPAVAGHAPAQEGAHGPPPPALSATAMTSSLAAMSRALGMVCGMLIPSLLIARAIGNDPIEAHPATLIDITTTTFALLAALNAVALVVSLFTASRPPSRA